MSFRLSIDGERWAQSQRRVAARLPGLVPVIKGNGYGFGAALLAARCQDLGVPTVAVGTAAEIAPVRRIFRGEVMVMAPLQLDDVPLATRATGALVWTVAQAEVLDRLAGLASAPRVVLELDSPLHQHGVPIAQLRSLAPVLRRVRLAGAALHLPSGGNRAAATGAVLRALAGLREAGVELEDLWVSHLTADEIDRLNRLEPEVRIRARIGTGLWLADRDAFTASGTVLDTRPVPGREPIGYRQRRSAAGALVVVSGGTGHGIGLRSSTARGGWFDRIQAATAGAAHAAGLSPSPFHWAGRRLRYADVPHMQVSMLLVPTGTATPRIGDQLRCDVRMPVTTFDEITMTASTIDPAEPAGRSALLAG